MALLTDGTVSTLEDLVAYESAILEVASTEGIDLATKLSLAREEIAIAVDAVLSRQSDSSYQVMWGTRPALKNVVVTEPLHKWHTFQTLALTYRDAYHRQLNDRYGAKYKEYDRRASWASAALFQTGIGIVLDPVAQATKPELTTIPGPLPAATYYVRVAWVGGQGEEGCPSELTVIAAPEGSVPSVTASNPPENTRGLNVYVGLTHPDLQLQNEVSIPAGQAWALPAAGLRTGRAPGNGQSPDTYVQVSQNGVLLRG